MATVSEYIFSINNFFSKDIKSTTPDIEVKMNPDSYHPYYQPIVDLSNGRIFAYESLARTETDSGVVVSAGSIFKNHSLEQDLILEIDRDIRRRALKKIQTFKGDELLSINISPVWVDRMASFSNSPTLQMIEQLDVDPSRVVIELTEDFGDVAKLKKIADSYRKHGIKVAIDDVGSGYSQIDRIAEIEPDIVKFDMNFFKNAAKGGIWADLTLSLSSFAKRSGCQIVFEGVETVGEFHFAIECNADFVQGWLFSKALPEPIETNHFVEHVRELKTSYLERKTLRLSNEVSHNKSIIDKINDLTAYFRTHTFPEKLMYEKLSESGISKSYICDLSAHQISPNYIYTQKGLVVDTRKMTSNWSHRPYFPLFLSIGSVDMDRIVVSETYKDRESGNLCRTYISKLSHDKLLLTDVVAKDSILLSI